MLLSPWESESEVINERKWVIFYETLAWGKGKPILLFSVKKKYQAEHGGSHL
jgi:hypothetical protein